MGRVIAASDGDGYADQMAKADTEGRICSVPHDAGRAVYTFWGFGQDESVAIWAIQLLDREAHAINFYSHDGLEHCAKALDDWRNKLEYLFGEHIWPHDRAAVIKKRSEIMLSLGYRVNVLDRAETERSKIGNCWFDAKKCDQGINSLKSYREEWNQDRGAMEATVNWAKPATAAFETFTQWGGPARHRQAADLNTAYVV